MDIPVRVSRQIDSALWTLIRAGREGIDGGSAGDNLVPYGPKLKTRTTAWRSRTSDISEMLYLARSRVRVGSNPVPGQANLYFLGWTDDVDNPDPEVSPFPTVREFEEAAWVALGLVIGKTCPRAATDPEAWAKFRVSKGNGGPGGGKSSPDAPLRSLCAENPKSEPSGVSPGSALAAKRWEGHTPRRFNIAGREVTMKEYKAILAEKKQGSLL